MPRTRKPKTIKFMLEFEKPPKDEVIEAVRCSYCKAPKGKGCSTQVWSWPSDDGQKHGGNKMSDLHHDRYAEYMNLETIYRGTLYKIK